jgi:hypothetical protein
MPNDKNWDKIVAALKKAGKTTWDVSLPGIITKEAKKRIEKKITRNKKGEIIMRK